MKKCIFAAALLVALCSANIHSQTVQIIEEYHIPMFPVTTAVNGTKLCHLAFNVGPVAKVFDSLQKVLRPGYYDMVFEKIRIYTSGNVFQRTNLRFKEVVPQQCPIINDCRYDIPCYTEYVEGSIQVRPMLGELAYDPLIAGFLQEYFFGKHLEYGMCYTISIFDTVDLETSERIIVFVSINRKDYIQTIQK